MFVVPSNHTTTAVWTVMVRYFNQTVQCRKSMEQLAYIHAPTIGMTLFHMIRIWIIFTLTPLAADAQSTRTVTTTYGKMRGVLRQFPNSDLRAVETYKGIRYATLMGNDLRFMPPTGRSERWHDVRVMYKFKPVCPQRVPNIDELRHRIPSRRLAYIQRVMPFISEQSEDCLYLNIYVPTPGTSPVVLLVDAR